MADLEDIDMLNTLIAEQLTSEGIEPGIAQQVAQSTVTQLQIQRGGSKIYIASIRSQQHKSILLAWRKSDGSPASIKAIADDHGVHEKTVRRIISKARPKRQARSGGFGNDEWNL